jgi:prevent-host-death family protein
MTTVGTYEAKTKFTHLLARVARGEKFVITRRGVPVAMLVPSPTEKVDVPAIIARMKELRRGNTLGKGLTLREMIEEGRRY